VAASVGRTRYRGTPIPVATTGLGVLPQGSGVIIIDYAP